MEESSFQKWSLWSLTGLLSFVLVFPSFVSGLGSMSSASAAYGENGPAFCGLRVDGSHIADCFGSDIASIYGAPRRLPLSGLTAGDGFVCGLTVATQQPYCWGNNVYVQAGVPASRGPRVSYVSICAGDNHLCALRNLNVNGSEGPSVDCWGYNMTGSFVDDHVIFITAGSLFTCGLFTSNRTAVCWGDETGSGVVSEVPKLARFRSIAAGGYHVCGILLKDGHTLCWGRGFDAQSVAPGNTLFSSLVGGKFHTCGLLAANHTPLCWGLTNLPKSTPLPSTSRFLALVAGDYYTCGISTDSLQPFCWGSEYPAALPTAVSPGVCSSHPCGTDRYRFVMKGSLCRNSQHVCVACSQGCPTGMYESVPCGANGDRQCTANCSNNCPTHKKHATSIQTPIIIAELAVAVVVITLIFVMAFFWVKCKLCRNEYATDGKSIKQQSGKKGSSRASFRKEKVGPELEEPNTFRAELFSFQELERATCGFAKHNELGKGSFSCVYRGVLGDGRVVAVKRALAIANEQDSKEFRNELDLLSRLNHAHLLNLLGFCDDGRERLLVYEFMSNGTLHEQLHGKSKGSLNWVRRVTIAVQAARGLEYLHGYACPSVIHRDIKSSNILLDDEWNARVSDFGLSLLGPPDSNSALSELPAGTLGYLDPEYYRLHYLTTKSDVYSFGVLLLEILSGRKAIDMQYEDGNIVEWAVPLIKAGEIPSILDQRLEMPEDNLEAMDRIAKIAARCVKMKGKDRPSMDKVTTGLERALAMLMGTPSAGGQAPILPSEVILGSSRFHRKPSQKSGRSEFGSSSEATTATTAAAVVAVTQYDDRHEFRHPSSVTFPSMSSSQRRKSSSMSSDVEADVRLKVIQKLSEEDPDDRQQLQVPEIHPASPQGQEELFLKANF